MTLFIGGPGDVHISAMLSQTNPGVQHIRKIYLRLDKIASRGDSDSDSSDNSSDEEEPMKFEEPKVAARQGGWPLLIPVLTGYALTSFKLNLP